MRKDKTEWIGGKVWQMLSSNLGIDSINMDVEHAQRLGRYQEGVKPRKIIVKNFHTLKVQYPFFFEEIKGHKHLHIRSMLK